MYYKIPILDPYFISIGNHCIVIFYVYTIHTLAQIVSDNNRGSSTTYPPLRYLHAALDRDSICLHDGITTPLRRNLRYWVRDIVGTSNTSSSGYCAQGV